MSPDLGALAVSELLARTASKEPVPGGGAAAALVGALGAALGSMVVAYSEGRSDLEAHAPRHEQAAARLASLRADALALADADAAAYAALNALWRKPTDDPERRERFPAAVEAAIEAPSRVVDAALATLEQLDALRGRSNRHLASDLVAAAVLAEASARAAALNVRVNLPLLEDEARRAVLAEALEARLNRAAALCRGIEDRPRDVAD